MISPSLTPESLALNKKIKLGVLASGSGTNFEAVAKAIACQKLNAQIQVLIYNNPEAKVTEKAENFQIPAVLLNHRKFASREDLDQKIVEVLQGYEVDLVVMAGGMRVVTPVLIDAYPNKLVNIHPSLLPSFRGIRAIAQALEAGVKITGCTVHLVVPEVDAGPVLIQAGVPILADDTEETLHQRIQVQEHLILPQGIALAAKLNNLA